MTFRNSVVASMLVLSSPMCVASECDLLSDLAERRGLYQFYNCKVDIEIRRFEQAGSSGFEGSLYLMDLRNNTELAIPFKRRACSLAKGANLMAISRERTGFSWTLREQAIVWQDSETKLLMVSGFVKGLFDGDVVNRVANCRGVNPREALERVR